MAEGLILETSFLVDLERERRTGRHGPATRFLERSADETFFVTPQIAGEIASGTASENRRAWEASMVSFQVLPCTPDVCWVYGRLFQDLKREGLLIGLNDLWIAAAALSHEKALVTADLDHFGRIPHLQVVAYRS